ncbi:MAG: UDP-2,3-diacylglucosamine diphosphatase [Rikenellaceae bacterium]
MGKSKDRKISQEGDSKRYRTIVVSDVHLGSKWSSAKEATRFIQENSCERLILCGDIIDGWAIMRGSREKWKRKHTAFASAVLDASTDTEVIYIKGNHDDFLDRLVPMQFSNISILTDYTLESADGKRYFVLHGDLFDNVTTSAKWLSKLGDIGYSTLLMLNRIYNFIRDKRGLPYSSFASNIKQRVKTSVSQMSNFEQNLADLARSKRCQGVICGHIHRPEIKDIGGVTYLNSGDWIDSLSALVEDFEGNWSLIFQEKKQEQKEEK